MSCNPSFGGIGKGKSWKIRRKLRNLNFQAIWSEKLTLWTGCVVGFVINLLSLIKVIIQIFFNLKKDKSNFWALNRAQGPAVLGLRAQIDRKLYKKHIQAEISQTKNLEVFEGEVAEILVKEGRIEGVKMKNDKVIR